MAFKSVDVTLKIRSRLPKSNQQFPTLCEFEKNPLTGSEDYAQKPYFGHFKVPD